MEASREDVLEIFEEAAGFGSKHYWGDWGEGLSEHHGSGGSRGTSDERLFSPGELLQIRRHRRRVVARALKKRIDRELLILRKPPPPIVSTTVTDQCPSCGNTREWREGVRWPFVAGFGRGGYRYSGCCFENKRAA